jgi:hypothetical protein
MEEVYDWQSILARLKGRFTMLLVTLMTVTMLSPFTEGRPIFDRLLDLAVFAMMITALATVWRHRGLFLVALIIGLGSFVGRALDIFGDVNEALPLSFGLRFGFTFIVTISIFGDVIRSRRVTMDTVFGACCVYLLMAVSWANIYILMELVQSGSFQLALTGSGDLWSGAGAADSQLYYFSLITLTTVGYGEIVPLTAPARSFAALEGVVGQLYVAVILARLVSLQVTDRMTKKG